MTSQSFSTAFVVDRTTAEVFAAIVDVRAWWSGDIEGHTDRLGEFTYRYEDIHYSRQRITELRPAQRIVWRVLDAYLSFTEDPREWVGTEITFDLRPQADQTQVCFSHLGLSPELECFDQCSSAWGFYINESLYGLITAGTGQPNPGPGVAGLR